MFDLTHTQGTYIHTYIASDTLFFWSAWIHPIIDCEYPQSSCQLLHETTCEYSIPVYGSTPVDVFLSLFQSILLYSCLILILLSLWMLRYVEG